MPKSPSETPKKKSSEESRYRTIKAYENREFLHSRDARALRIQAEYLEPETRFENFNIKDTIVFFGSYFDYNTFIA